MSRALPTASWIAFGVISWKTIRLTGTFGFSSSSRCQAIASPSRSSSVARKSSSAPLSRSLSLRICARLSAGTTYSGSKWSSTFTPSRAQGRPLYFAGISSAPLGRSRMWPKLDSTTYPDPRKPAIIRAFFGDSTITRRRPADVFVPAAPATALLALAFSSCRQRP